MFKIWARSYLFRPVRPYRLSAELQANNRSFLSCLSLLIVKPASSSMAFQNPWPHPRCFSSSSSSTLQVGGTAHGAVPPRGPSRILAPMYSSVAPPLSTWRREPKRVTVATTTEVCRHSDGRPQARDDLGSWQWRRWWWQARRAFLNDSGDRHCSPQMWIWIWRGRAQIWAGSALIWIYNFILFLKINFLCRFLNSWHLKLIFLLVYINQHKNSLLFYHTNYIR
jgi:hypothetical protein